MTTNKLLATAIRFTLYGMNVQTVVASLTCISWVNKNQFHPKLNRLVVNKLSQLVETPTIRKSAFSFAARQGVCPFSDSGQFFQGNYLVLILGRLNNLVAGNVINVSLKTPFLSRQPLLKFSASSPTTSSAFRGLVLELRSNSGVFVPNLSYALSTEFIPVRSNRNICSAQINAQYFISIFRRWWLRLKLNVQVICTIFTFYQSRCFWVLSFQQSPLVIANGKAESFSTTNQRQASCPVFLFKTERSCIVGSRSRRKFLNLKSFLSGSLAISRYSPYRMNSQLRRQAKQRPDIVINQGLHRQFVYQSWWCSLVHILASICKSLQRRINFGDLFRCDLDFAGYCQDLFHLPIISQYVRKSKLLNCSSSLIRLLQILRRRTFRNLRAIPPATNPSTDLVGDSLLWKLKRWRNSKLCLVMGRNDRTASHPFSEEMEAKGKSIENTHPWSGTSRTESIPLFSETERCEIVSPSPNPDLSVPI
jgi:hypothetical protein